MLTYGIEISANEYPLLVNLLMEGSIYIEDSKYLYGKSSIGGGDVQLGTVDFLGEVESYLTAHPTPDTW